MDTKIVQEDWPCDTFDWGTENSQVKYGDQLLEESRVDICKSGWSEAEREIVFHTVSVDLNLQTIWRHIVSSG